jgi:stearoyl-CoA desaturase (delta-9 desaturase)
VLLPTMASFLALAKSSAVSKASKPEEPEPSSSSSEDDAYDDDETAVDDDNYVTKTLLREPPLPPITLANLWQNVALVSSLAITIVPALAIYGGLTTKLTLPTALWSIVYYFITGLGITAGAFFCLFTLGFVPKY